MNTQTHRPVNEGPSALPVQRSVARSAGRRARLARALALGLAVAASTACGHAGGDANLEDEESDVSQRLRVLEQEREDLRDAIEDVLTSIEEANHQINTVSDAQAGRCEDLRDAAAELQEIDASSLWKFR